MSKYGWANLGPREQGIADGRFASEADDFDADLGRLSHSARTQAMLAELTANANGTAGQVRRGVGSPEGSVIAPVGTLYEQLDGANGVVVWVKNSGTGNTGWRSLQTGLGLYNVKDFGAKGDGVTNDTVALKAAIASLPLGGGTVYFPVGIYMVSDTIVLPVDRTVTLAGPQQAYRIGADDTADGAILRRAAGFTGVLVQQTGVLTPRAAQGARLSHLTLDGVGLAGDLVFFDFTQNTQFDDVQFCRADGHALKLFGMTNGWAQNIRVLECGSATKAAVWLDYSVTGARPSSSFDIIGSQFENNFGTHLLLDNANNTTSLGTTDIQVSGCKFEQTGITVPVGLPIIVSKSTSHSYINAVISGGDAYGATHLLFDGPGGVSSQVSSRRVVVDCRFTVFSGTDADNPQYLVDVVKGSDIVIRGTFHHGGGNGGAQVRIASQTAAANLNGPERIFLDPANTYSQPLSGVAISGVPAGPTGVSADRGDATQTVIWGVDAPTQRFATDLAADRTVHLSKTSGSGVRIPPQGARFVIVRTGLGAGKLQLLTGFGGSQIAQIPAYTAATVTVEYNGTDWVVVGYDVHEPQCAPFATKTTTYTANNKDFAILCDATSAAFTVNLPAVASNYGRRFLIKKIDSSANAITINPNASETLDGDLTRLLTAQYQWCMVQSDGTQWHVIAGSRVVQGWAAKTTTYAVVDSDDGLFLGGTFTLTLQSAATRRRPLMLRCTSGTITVARAGSDTIEGATSVTLIAGETATLMPNGTNWLLVG